MKRTKFAILAAALLLAAFQFDACKEADVETGTLKVIVSEGVSGTPAAGTYTIEVGKTQAYNYSLEAGFNKLTVLLDGVAVAASGSLTVTGNHTLQAYSDNNLQYTLTVSKAEGVNGTPASGAYTHLQGSKVEYEYSAAEGYSDLAVTLDGNNVASHGTVTMSGDHTLTASATKKFNVQGPWILSESYNDGSSFKVTVTFSGNFITGTVTDSEGGSGTYDYSDVTLDFTLVFPDVTYTYKATFSSDNSMSGTCTRAHSADDTVSGTFTATRVTSASAPGATSRSGKGASPRT